MKRLRIFSILMTTWMLILLLCASREGFCENSIRPKHSLEVVVPGLIGNTYSEEIKTSGAFTIDPVRDFEIDGRYARRVHPFLNIGIAAHFRKYDKGYLQAGGSAYYTQNDFTTSVAGVSGFLQTSYTKNRFSPYIAAGGGYRRITINDEGIYYFRDRPDIVFRSSTESIMNKFGVVLFGGLRFSISRNIYTAIEIDYFTASSILDSTGGNVALGVSW